MPSSAPVARMLSLLYQAATELTIVANSKLSRCAVVELNAGASVATSAASRSFFKLQKPSESGSSAKRATSQRRKASAIGSATT